MIKRRLITFVASIITPAVFGFLLYILLNRIQFPLFLKLGLPAVFGYFLIGRGRLNSRRHFNAVDEAETDDSSVWFLLRYGIPFLAAPILGIVADYVDWNYGFFIPTVSALATASLVFLIALRSSYGGMPVERFIPLRGRVLLTFRKARKLAASLGYTNDGLSFAGLKVPFAKALQHFLIVGSSGSGKTIIIRKLLIDICRYMKKSQACQAVVFDAKLDVIPALQQYTSGQLPIYDLHPFRPGCFAWDIADDVRTSRDAELAALTLFPAPQRPSNDQEFFREGPRTLIEELIRSLQKVAPRNWTLRDVYILMTTPSLCRQMLEKLPDSKIQIQDLIEDFFEGDPRTTSNMRITIRAKFRRFRHIAAAWHVAQREGRVVSLKQWAKTGKGFLVLGADKLEDSAINSVNRLVMTLLGKHWLEDPTSATAPRHFLVLDEVQSAGELDLLHKLMTEGREKGVSAILGFQEVGSMQRVYGKENADAILGQCGLKAFLRIEGEQTAEWASRMIGDVEQLEYTYGRSTNHSAQQGGTTSYSQQEQIVRKPAVMPSQFMTLPVTSLENGLSGFYGVNEIGVWPHHMPGSEFPSRPDPTVSSNTSIETDEVDDVQLQPFTKEDFSRLKLVDTSEVSEIEEVIPQAEPLPQKPKSLRSVRKIQLEDDPH